MIEPRRKRVRWRRLIQVALAIALCLGGAALLAVVNVVRGPVAWTRPAPVATSPPRVDRLQADVALIAGDLSPRSYRERDALAAVAAHVETTFRQSGLDVALQAYEADGQTYTNVVARRQGRDPKAGIVVLTAHYDAPGASPGADDNASSVAVLLEVARTLGSDRGQRSLWLVATSTEEPPFFWTDGMGAHALAKSLKESGTPIHVMASLDCVGFYSDKGGSQSFPATAASVLYPSTGNFLAVIGDLDAGAGIKVVKRGLRAQRDLDIYSFRAPRVVHGVMLSDHYWFRELGYPGVMITDTAFFRNPNYHELSDTPDTLDYDRLASVVLGVHGVLREAGAAP